MNIQPRPKNNLFAAAKPRRYSGLTGSTPTQVILTPANGMPPNHTTKLINRLMTNQTHNNFFLLKIGVLTIKLSLSVGNFPNMVEGVRIVDRSFQNFFQRTHFEPGKFIFGF